MWRVRSRLQSTEEGFENEAEETDGAWLQRKDEESGGGGREVPGRPLSSCWRRRVTDGVRSLRRKVGWVSPTGSFYTVLLPEDRHLSRRQITCWMDK